MGYRIAYPVKHFKSRKFQTDPIPNIAEKIPRGCCLLIVLSAIVAGMVLILKNVPADGR